MGCLQSRVTGSNRTRNPGRNKQSIGERSGFTSAVTSAGYSRLKVKLLARLVVEVGWGELDRGYESSGRSPPRGFGVRKVRKTPPFANITTFNHSTSRLVVSAANIDQKLANKIYETVFLYLLLVHHNRFGMHKFTKTPLPTKSAPSAIAITSMRQSAFVVHS